MNSPTRILFVCTGNICRSPLAEAVLQKELEERGVADHFVVDSAGTDAYHVGERADQRMRSVARKHGVQVRTRSRRVTTEDFASCDRIYAMDTGHIRSLQRYTISDAERKKIALFRDHDLVTSDRSYPDVPDPWYGDINGFEAVYAIVSRTCARIAESLLLESR